MSRWEPDGRGRLERAALELYTEQGYERTTVAEIAERAGLTKRTFFRHYADKRDVLFAGASILQDVVVRAVADAPGSAAPVDAVATGLDAAADLLAQRRDEARHRRIVIAANADLQERELVKLATLAAAIAEALRARGVGDRAASLLAEAGIAAFKVAFELWATDQDTPDLGELIRDCLAELKTTL